MATSNGPEAVDLPQLQLCFPLEQAMLEKVLMLITEAAVVAGIYWAEARATAAWPAIHRILPTT